jgi:hypothetical protein
MSSMMDGGNLEAKTATQSTVGEESSLEVVTDV